MLIAIGNIIGGVKRAAIVLVTKFLITNTGDQLVTNTGDSIVVSSRESI